MSARILFVGDIHLGRRPGGLPGNLEQHGLSVAELTPAAAWRSTVDWAVAHDVDAVVLAGDVVESDNARFEAYGRLREGAERLLRGGEPYSEARLEVVILRMLKSSSRENCSLVCTLPR